MFRRTTSVLYSLFILGFWMMDSYAFSQNTITSEADLKKQANKFFEEEEFAKAYPLFSQLLSLYPKDAQYNYKFGTCLLFSSNDKEKAIPYIEYAAKAQKQEVDKEVFFYLGKAYHLNYRFADAIRQYNTYISTAPSRQIAKYDVGRQIEMCENGKRLLRSVSELSVFEKKDVPVSDFFRSYYLTEFNAKLIIKPDEMKTSFDKKKNDESLIYLAPDRNQIYYSSYGEDGKNGRDIYSVRRTAAGDLTKKTLLPDVINTKYDEDYVFLHPNGKTLYFCSKGHNSMGGYDIFKSEFNKNTKSWDKPVNMDFPINTPDDDILLISDVNDKSAYFSSRRESAMGNITVYNIKLERKRLDVAIIRGTLKKNVGDKIPKATITVTKVSSEGVSQGKEEVVSISNTNAADGSYRLNLPNGGKFKFTVASTGFKKSSGLVEIPNQQEIKLLKQEIVLVNENGEDKIIIKNEFNAQTDSADIALAVEYIKSKASLEVSHDEEEEASDTVEENAPALKGDEVTPAMVGEIPDTSLHPLGQGASGGGKVVAPVTNTDIIAMAYEDAKATQKEANELRKNSDASLLLTNQKNDLSVQKNNAAEELMKSAEMTTNQEKKMAQIDKSTSRWKESEMLSKESALLLTLSNQMDNLAKAKQQQADAELKYAKDLDNAIKSGASEKKMNELLAQKEALDKKREMLKNEAAISADLYKQAEDKQSEASRSMAKYIGAQLDAEDLQSEAKRLRTEAGKTKNETMSQNQIQQAKELEKEAETKKKNAETYSANTKQLQQQADSLRNIASLSSSEMKKILPAGTGTPATSAAASAVSIKSTASSSVTVTPAASPLTKDSTYADVFLNRMHEAEKKPKELDKQEALAVIYQSWTDSLDNQISILQKQLPSASNEADKNKFQNDIYALKSSAEDKRQKASESRNKVDNLKLKEALDAASAIPIDTGKTAVSTNTVTATNTKTTEISSQPAASSPTASPENLRGADNINNYYQNKQKESSTETNEYAKKEKEVKIYTDWAYSLNAESLRMKKDGNASKADDAEKASKEKQLLAKQTADEVTQIKTEHPDWVESAQKQPEAVAARLPDGQAGSQTATYETKNESTTQQPDKQTVSTNTISAANPVINQSANAPINNSTVVPESVKNKNEYSHYISLKNESDLLKKNAEKQNRQATDIQKISDEQFKESDKVSKQIENSKDKNEILKLEQQSNNLIIQSLKNQAKADSIKVIAKNSEAEANSKQKESELYLQSLDKAAYEEIVSATSIPKDETKSSVPVTAGTTKTESPAQTVTPAATNTLVASNPLATEKVSLVPAVTSSAGMKTESSSDTAKRETTATEQKTKITIQPAIVEAATFPAKTKSDSAPINIAAAASPELLKYYDALFDKLEFKGAAYSPSKPIPVDAPMPEGLVFKVQIGAFRNPIPQNLFKGLKPITAETTPQGLKRYTAGLFQKFYTANAAKEDVKNLGYRDAFVVAFFNGKRILMSDAIAKAKEGGENIDWSAATGGTAADVPATGAGTSAAETMDVKSVNGLFYTVQIGVFSNPVSSAQLYNISPLNSEKTDNGLIRYSTGRFDDELKAGISKNSIAGKGISDAFVAAYYNGKRISLTAAKNIIDSQGKEILSKDKQEYSFVPSDTTTSEKSATALTTSANKGIVFKVQVGAYREQVPIEEANKLLKISGMRIKTFTDENGLLVYTAGEFLEYESANKLKTRIINEGITGAFVIAFKDGKKISVNDALDLIKKR